MPRWGDMFARIQWQVVLLSEVRFEKKLWIKQVKKYNFRGDPFHTPYTTPFPTWRSTRPTSYCPGGSRPTNYCTRDFDCSFNERCTNGGCCPVTFPPNNTGNCRRLDCYTLPEPPYGCYLYNVQRHNNGCYRCWCFLQQYSNITNTQLHRQLSHIVTWWRQQ